MKHFGCIVFFLSGCLKFPQHTLPSSVEKPLAEVLVSSRVDKALVAPGEPIQFTVTVNAESHMKLAFPEIGDRIRGFRIVDYGTGESNEGGDRKITHKWYKLISDFSGSYILPAIEISYVTPGNETKQVKTAEIFVEVKSPEVKEPDPGADIRDIKDLQKTPINTLLWLSVIFGLLLAALVGYWIWRHSKAGTKKSLDRAEPPHLAALRQIEYLGSQLNSNGIPPKLFHYTLSETIRSYVEGRFSIRVTDMTLEEIRRAIIDPAFPEIEKAHFLDILIATDLVKFTDHVPHGDHTIDLLKNAKAFVERTTPQELPGNGGSVV